MIKALRRKFIAITMASVTLVFILVLGVINYANYTTVSNRLDMEMSMLIEREEDIRDEMKTEPPAGVKRDNDRKPGDGRGLRDFRRDIFTTEEKSHFTVKIKDDKVQNVIINGPAGGKDDKVIEEDAAKEMAASLYENGKDYGYSGDYKYAVSYDEDEKTYSYLFLDCREEIDSAKRFLAVSIIIGIIGDVLVFLLVSSLSRFVTKPAAESLEKQKRFITDASHELKTPLAVIEANTEVMEMTGGENDWTKSNRRQIARLSNLIEKLVFLSRMDEENANYLNMADFDISEAAKDTAEGFLTRADALELEMHLDIEDNVNYHGDEGMIRQLLSLLLDNAMKYTAEKGEVLLSLMSRDRGKHRVRIIQSNPVDSIEKGNLDMLFDRFYRADESRNSEKGGHGIGLSVARAIVNAHGGQIRAESKDGKSIIFTVDL